MIFLSYTCCDAQLALHLVGKEGLFACIKLITL